MSRQNPIILHQTAAGLHTPSVREVLAGCTIADVAPKTVLPTICTVNDEYVLRTDWELVDLEVGDVVVFHSMPQGGGGGGSLTTILGIVLIVAGVLTNITPLIYAGAALIAGGLIAAPTISPISMNTPDAAASPSYNIQLSGNTVRLGQPRPTIYGRHRIIPDFESFPYTEFNEDDEQIYYALLSVGMMEKFTVESVEIDDTPINHFEDVTIRWIGPQYNTSVPTIVHPAVVTAPEIANQELEYGKYVGPFAVCGPTLRTTRIDIDVVLPKGLYYANDAGDLDEKTVSWLVEARKITDQGAPAGSWFMLGVEEITAAVNKAIRRTYSYTVAAARYEVRMQRQSAKDLNTRAANDITWYGLKAFLNLPVALDSASNFIELKIRASSQLSGLSQRRVAVVVHRWLKAWDPDTGWAPYQKSSSIAWALADVLKNQDYGAQLSDARIDLQTLYELDQIWSSRYDYFNGIFDARITIWSALQTIARVGRAKPAMRGSVFTFFRDGPQDLPTCVFTMRNIKRDSFSTTVDFVREDEPDGIWVEYFDESSWSNNSVLIPMPGVDDPVNTTEISLHGITNKLQAQREGSYHAAAAMYRRQPVSFVTELEGYIPAVGDLIGVSHDLFSGSVSGDITAWDSGTKTAQVSEELSWDSSAHYMLLSTPEGDASGPYEVVQGSDSRTVVFVAAPDFELRYGTESERTRFAFGAGSSYTVNCIITSIEPRSDTEIGINALVEDVRVHTADNAYLGNGSIGGGGGGSTGATRIARYAPAGIPSYDDATDAQRDRYGFYSTPERTVGNNSDPGYVYDT